MSVGDFLSIIKIIQIQSTRVKAYRSDYACLKYPNIKHYYHAKFQAGEMLRLNIATSTYLNIDHLPRRHDPWLCICNDFRWIVLWNIAYSCHAWGCHASGHVPSIEVHFIQCLRPRTNRESEYQQRRSSDYLECKLYAVSNRCGGWWIQQLS